MQTAKSSSSLNPLMKNYALLVLVSINFLNFKLGVDGFRILSKPNFEDDGPKGFNISYVKKTIKTKFGDIINCIDVDKQPAFNHPLLRNHKIQEVPNFPKEWMERFSIAQVIDLERLGFNRECPHGTVPVRRNTSKMSITSRREAMSNNETELVKMAAAVRLRRKDTRYVAARAQMDIQNPKCKLGESSSANIWFFDGNNENSNMILAGWEVNPTVYGDGNTRLSTFWADRIYNTGCYDLYCPGFVQVDRVVSLGTVLPKISIPEGPKYHITLNVFQDQETKNWWLHLEEANTPIGYWPEKIFSHFSNGASDLDFGGFVSKFPGQLPNPDMGSGIIPDGGANYNYVSYFSEIEYIGEDNVTRTPLDGDIQIYHDNPYGVEFYPSSPDKGANFLYGGPKSLSTFSMG